MEEQRRDKLQEDQDHSSADTVGVPEAIQSVVEQTSRADGLLIIADALHCYREHDSVCLIPDPAANVMLNNTDAINVNDANAFSVYLAGVEASDRIGRVLLDDVSAVTTGQVHDRSVSVYLAGATPDYIAGAMPDDASAININQANAFSIDNATQYLSMLHRAGGG